MANHFQYDAIVIGGGSAGLQAALTLGRVHRRTLLLDAGHYRNDPAHHMHNFLGHDGTPPHELRAAARADLAAYDTVAVRDAPVASVGLDGEVHLGGEVARALHRGRVGADAGEEHPLRVVAHRFRDSEP